MTCGTLSSLASSCGHQGLRSPSLGMGRMPTVALPRATAFSTSPLPATGVMRTRLP